MSKMQRTLRNLVFVSAAALSLGAISNLAVAAVSVQIEVPGK